MRKPIFPFQKPAVVVSLLLLISQAYSINDIIVSNYWEHQYQELEQRIPQNRNLAKVLASTSDVLDTNALILSKDQTPVDVMLRRTQLLLHDLKGSNTSSNIAEFERSLHKMQTSAKGLSKSDLSGTVKIKNQFMELCALNRRIAFDNPLLDFNDLLFIGYTFPSNESHMCDQYNPWNINMGGGLYILKGLKTATPILTDVLANSKVVSGKYAGSNLSGGAFLSPDLSFDGKTIVFAWSAPVNKCYHIFKVNIDGANLVQLTDGTSIEDNGLSNVNHNDFDPVWLPNGRIAFISDRRGGYGRCHTKGKPTFTLHSMKDDGGDIICLSFHETNEWHPSVDNEGKIVYTRWDYVDRDDCIAHHMWTCYPDGRDPRSYHGNYPFPLQTFTGTWYDGRGSRPFAEFTIRAIPNTQKYAAIAGPHHGYSFGELIMIDPTIEDDGKVSQVKRITSAWTGWPDGMGPYGTPWPLSEDYYLCNKDKTIILRDRFGDEQVIYSSNSWRPIYPIPVKPRTKPLAIATGTWQGERRNNKDHFRATIKINDVTIADLPLPAKIKVKSLRIVQLFPKETKLISNPRNGYPAEALIRMSLGTAPVETDGSVYCEAPVGKTIYFQLLDENGLAVRSMRSATYVHDGEQMACAGCHENKWKSIPTGANRIAFNRPPSPLSPEAGGVEPVNFYRLVKPVFAKNCVPCHQKQGKIDMSFGSLKQYAFYYCGDGGPFLNGDIGTGIKGGSRTVPGMFGASYSKLFKYLDSSHHDVSLTPDEYKRVTLWLDLNSMELGAESGLTDQRNGKLVWPRIDADSTNPQGIETNFPAPGSSAIISDAPVRSIRISKNKSLVSIENPDGMIEGVCLYDLSGRRLHQWRFNNAGRSVAIELNRFALAQGMYFLGVFGPGQKKRTERQAAFIIQ